MRIKVIGIGGIGGLVLPVLCRFLNFAFPESLITLIDGDKFERKNAERQSFPKIGNKARVIVASLRKMFPSLKFRAERCYVNNTNMRKLLIDGNVIFLCVDNHATRKLVSDRCEELTNVVLLSGGNEYHDGNIQVFWREEGYNQTLPIASVYAPEIQEPRDRNPGERGCEELRASQPQLIFANNFIAALLLNAFYAFLQRQLNYDEVYGDCLKNSARPVRRSGVIASSASTISPKTRRNPWQQRPPLRKSRVAKLKPKRERHPREN